VVNGSPLASYLYIFFSIFLLSRTAMSWGSFFFHLFFFPFRSCLRAGGFSGNEILGRGLLGVYIRCLNGMTRCMRRRMRHEGKEMYNLFYMWHEKNVVTNKYVSGNFNSVVHGCNGRPDGTDSGEL